MILYNKNPMKRILTISLAWLIGLSGVSVSAQNGYLIKGEIVDAIGPVIGVTVLEKGTTTGASTGINGDYSLTVSSKDAMVEISCIGYKTQVFKASEIPAKITIKEDAMLIEDVVVIGYGSQKKKEVTGSVASIKSENFNAGVRPILWDFFKVKLRV